MTTTTNTESEYDSAWPQYPGQRPHADTVDGADMTQNGGHVTVLPTDAAERKKYPLFTGCLNYFPNALLLVARCSFESNKQHHPDEPLHWDPNKSPDELDACGRHILEGEWDKVAWRALAHLERMIAQGWRPNMP